MPYLSASAMVIHCEEALYQVYAPLPLPLPRRLCSAFVFVSVGGITQKVVDEC